jgi:RND superfamily putative drug exporter
MTTELAAPDHTGADTRPKRSRTKTLLPWLVVAVWAGLVVGGYSLAGNLDSVTRDGQVDYLPASAQSTQVLQAEADLPHYRRSSTPTTARP